MHFTVPCPGIQALLSPPGAALQRSRLSTIPLFCRSQQSPPPAVLQLDCCLFS